MSVADSAEHNIDLATGVQPVPEWDQAAIAGGTMEAVVESAEVSVCACWVKRISDTIRTLQMIPAEDELPPETWIHLQFSWGGKPYALELAESDRYALCKLGGRVRRLYSDSAPGCMI